MLAIVGACAALVAQLATGGEPAAASASPCARYATPVPVRIEGRVVMRDQQPRANVVVRATTSRPRRELDTITDAAGRYVVTGFDVETAVALEFVDDANRLAATCTVRTSRREPTVAVDVVLEPPRDDATIPYGCQGDPGQVTPGAFTQGRAVRRAQEEEEPEREPTATFGLRMSDVERVWMGEDGATLRLAADATKALRAFADANVGRMALIRIERLPAARWWVQDGPGWSDSGLMSVPAAQLRGPLCELLALVADVEPPPLEIDLTADDVARVRWNEAAHAVDLTFTADVGTRLASAQRAEKRAPRGRALEVSLDGLHVMTIPARFEWGRPGTPVSWSFGVASPRLRARLAEIERRVGARTR